MRLIIFTAYFHPHKGGVESYVRDLFSGIAAEKIVITANTENAKSYEEWKGFKIHRLECWHILGNAFPIIKPSEFPRIDNILKTNPDFVITNTRFFHTSFLGARFAAKHKIPLIHIEHGTAHSPVKNPLSRILGVFYDHTFGRYIIKKAWKAIGISRASEKFIKHLYSRDTDSVYNSIDTSQFLCKRRIFNHKRKTLIYIGRLIYAKGVHDLLEVTKEMDVDVWIIGEGDYKEKLKKINRKAKFFGQKDASEIAELLSRADIFVNPSYAEGLPTSVLEAGAAGLPIIATDVGGTKEIVDDSENGFLIKPFDKKSLREKIIILSDNQKKCEKFSKKISLKIKKEFDWKRNRMRFQRIINEK